MKNKLTDLNNHLFAELERLSDEDICGDKLKEEILRAKAVTDVSSRIISNGGLILKLRVAEYDSDFAMKPLMLLEG